MTLDVVGSTPTIYPLKFISKLCTNISIKNNENFKKTSFNLKYNTYLYNIFEQKKEYIHSIKSLYYFSYFKNSDVNFIDFKDYSYISINKKKNHYYLSVFQNNKQYIHITLGSILKRLKIKKKCFRRTDEGFNAFTNIFNFNLKALKNDRKNIIVVLNFVDFKFFKLKNYFFKKIILKNFFFFKIKKPFNKIFYRKYKSIKKRLRKRYVKITLKQN